VSDVELLEENAEKPEKSGESADLANKSIIKAAALLYELGNHPQGASVTELARHTRLSRPTAFRLLLSLEQTSFVERLGTKYRLGWKVAHLGRLADPNTGLVNRIGPLLKAAANEMHEAIGYGVVYGETTLDLIAEELPESRLFNFSYDYLGRDFPLHASAMGKLVLAELPDSRIKQLLPETLPKLTRFTLTSRRALLSALQHVRQQGYAVVDDELEESHYALAVAVRNPAGRMIGTVAVTGPGQRIKQRTENELAEPLLKTAAEISALLTRDN